MPIRNVNNSAWSVNIDKLTTQEIEEKPLGPEDAPVVLDTVTKTLKYYNQEEWKDAGSGGGGDPVVITGETVVISSDVVTQTRTSINLLNIDDAEWTDGATIPIGGDLENDASGTKFISQPIPVRDGDRLRRTRLDTYRYLRADKSIVPFSDPVYAGNNRLNDIKVVFDDPSDDIAYIQVSGLLSNKGVDDMLVHFRDCDTSGNPVVVPTGWVDWDIFVDNFDEWRVDRKVSEKVDGLNLNDPYTAYYAGYYQQATGAFNKSCPSTGLIQASPNDWYAVNTPGNVQITFFVASRNFIAGSGVVGKNAKAPSNAAFVSFQLPSNTVDYYSIVVSRGKKAIPDATRYRYRPVGVKDVVDARLGIVGDSISTEGTSSYADTGYGIAIARALNVPSIQNYSVSGWRFENFANDLTFYNADNTHCIIALGTNDWGFGNDVFGTIADSDYQSDSANYPDSFYGNMAKLYHGILDLNPETRMGMLAPIHRINENSDNLQGKKLSDYVNAIKEFCSYVGCPLLDLYQSSNLNPSRPDHLPLYFNSDGIHPLDESIEKYMSPKIIEFFRSIDNNLE